MIIVRLSGGLGNQMFEYSLARAVSLKIGAPLKVDLAFLLDRNPHLHKFPYYDYCLNIFKAPIEIATKKEVPFIYRKHLFDRAIFILDHARAGLISNPGKEKEGLRYDPSFFSLKDGAYLEGIWENPRYFEDIRDVIKNDFTVREDIKSVHPEIQEKMGSTDSICVHVRRGDYLQLPGNENVKQPDYFRRGVDIIKQKVKSPHVFVFSDDIPWCKENLSFDCPTSFMERNHLGVDHHLMRCCKHFAIQNSTFAWWAAWLGEYPGKIVVTAKRWFPENAAFADRDLLPKDWLNVL